MKPSNALGYVRRAVVVVAVCGVTSAAFADAHSTLRAADGLVAGDVDWVAADGELIAFGSDRRLVLARSTPTLTVRRELPLSAEVLEAVLVETDLYVNEGSRVRLLDLDTSPVRPHAVHFRGDLRGRLRVARLIDHLVVAEDGVGLRFVLLRIPPSAPQPRRHGHGPHESREVAALALPKNFRALTTFENRVYAATDDGEILVIDVADLLAPVEARRLPTVRSIRADDVRALAASRSRLYVLGATGLRILDLTDDAKPIVATDATITGSALHLAGRRLLVAAGSLGLRMFRDTSEVLATVDVTVGNDFFAPSSVTIDVGDTVRWTKTTGYHNVESCDGSQEACGGASATEFFRSGDATIDPFTFSHTFGSPGDNPYICIVHFNMTGTVTVKDEGSCDDGVECTNDFGTPGNCSNVPNHAMCNDGNACNGVETCDTVSDCQSGTPPNCNDGVACTQDSCNAQTGCVNTPNNGACSNGNACDGAETCHPANGCQAGSPLNCNDGIACTVDSCSSGSGCVNTVNDAVCDNDDVCDGAESCDPGTGCVAGAPLVCDDGDPCSGFESCDSSAGCQAGTPLDDGTSCKDADMCNGVETCLSGVCTSGTPLPDADADGVCDELDVCPDAFDPFQLNTDTDPFGNVCDCAPSDGAAWDIPTATTELTLVHDGGDGGTTALNWNPPSMPGGTSVVYDTLRSTDAADFVTDADCIESDGSDTASFDATTPDPGVSHFFLIRPETVCGAGPLCADSSDTPRTGRDCP